MAGWILTLATAWLPAQAGATTADDICGPAVDPCRVTRNIPITPGSMIDFGTRRLIIANHGTLDLDSGTMTLRAGEFTIEDGGAVDAKGTAQTSGGKVSVLANIISIAGPVDASGAPGGAVTLSSTGPLTLGAALEVRSRSSDSGGGSAEVQGTNITINSAARINALGGGEDFGGDIQVTATGTLSISGGLNASGGDGGSIDLDAGAALTVSPGVTLNADATAGGGSGGEIALRADGAVSMNGELTAAGRNGSVDTGAGDGGSISIDADSIVIMQVAARVRASAGSPDGVGGDIDLVADSGLIDVRGELEARGPGVDSNGGSVSLDASGTTSLVGKIDVSGGRGGGGEIDVLGTGDIEIVAGATLSAEASSSGDGGDVDISSSDADVRVTGMVVSDGGPTQGSTGGTITVFGCSVDVASAGRLSNLRNNGTNTIIGRDLAVIGGTVRADTSTGRNVFHYAGPEYEPAILPGAQVDPPESLFIDASVVPCNPVNTRTPTITGVPTVTRTMARTPTATPTRTSSNPVRSRTATATDIPTPTVTPAPVVCVGDCDGSGSVSISDLITGVNISLGLQPLTRCPPFDPDGSGTVAVNELIQGVNNSLNSCPDEN